MHLKTLILTAWMMLGLSWQAQANPPQQRTASNTWKQALKLYRAYEFQRAIPLLRQVVSHPPKHWTKAQRAYALVVLSFCRYNLAQPGEASKLFNGALALDRRVKLPPQVPPHVRKRYEINRARWLQKQPKRNDKKQNVGNAKKRSQTPIFKQKKPKTVRRPKKRPTQRPQPRVASHQKQKTPHAKKGFRYTGSVVVLSGAALVGGGALAMFIGSQGAYQHAIEFNRQRADSAKTISGSYEQSYQLGFASMIAGISAGAIAAVGVGLLCYQLLQPKPTKQPPPQPTPSAPKEAHTLLQR